MVRSNTRYRLPGRLRRDAAKVLLIGIVLMALPQLVAHPVISEAMAPLGLVGGILAVLGAVVLRVAPRTPADVRSVPEDGEPTVALSRLPLSHMESTNMEGTSEPDARDTGLADPDDQPKPFEWSHALFDRIDPRRFGALVEAVYRQAGFETRAARHGADDLVWLHAPRARQGPVGVARSSANPERVGIDRVRELVDLMASHGVRRGHFIGSAGFTPEAEAFGSEHGVHLLDGSGLLALVERRSHRQQAELFELLELATVREPAAALRAADALRQSGQRAPREAVMA